jgi:hypothetical protein
MKKWPPSSSSTKVAIGKFYIAIDNNLQAKHYNAYRFIERTIESKKHPSAAMKYGVEDLEVQALQTKVKECRECIQRLITDFSKMKNDLDSTQGTLEDITNHMMGIL